MQFIRDLEKFLRSREFKLIIVIGYVLFLSYNTYYVFYSISDFEPIWRMIASAMAGILIALGIMTYTLDGDEDMANKFAWFERSISAYYFIITLGWDWGLIPAFSFVMMMPTALKNYVNTFNKSAESSTNSHETGYKPEFMHMQNETLQQENRDLHNDLDSLDKKYQLLIHESKQAEEYYKKRIHELSNPEISISDPSQLSNEQLKNAIDKSGPDIFS